MQDVTAHRTGVILVVVSALVFSSAGIFTKGVETSAWEIIFWRGIGAAGFTLIWLIMRKQLRFELSALGWPGLWAALFGAAGTAAFIPAFKLSTVANVSLIYGAAPFVAAGLSWLILREPPSRKTFIASLVAIGGVLVILWGSFGGLNLVGDLLALLMTVMMSGVMLIYRKYPDTTAALPAVLSSVFLLPLALLFGEPLSVPVTEIPVLLCFGLIFAIASVTLAEGARRLPAPQTALLSTLEMPFAPILALIFFAAIPQFQTIIGGMIILGAVLWSQYRSSTI